MCCRLSAWLVRRRQILGGSVMVIHQSFSECQGCVQGRKRIAELTDAFNRVCSENTDFVVQSNINENLIAELKVEIKRLREGRNE